MKQKNNTAVKWIVKTVGSANFLVVFLVALQAILSLSGVFYALVLRRIINSAVDGNRNAFFFFLVVLIGTLGIQILIRAICRFLNEYANSVVENRLKAKLFSSLLTAEYGSVTAIHSGEWMNRLTSDTVVCANGMTDILPGFIGMMIRLLGSLVLIFYLQPQLAWIIVPGGIVFVILTWVLRMPLKRFHKEVQETANRVAKTFKKLVAKVVVNM